MGETKLFKTPNRLNKLLCKMIHSFKKTVKKHHKVETPVGQDTVNAMTFKINN